jgi:hypothetical protein
MLHRLCIHMHIHTVHPLIHFPFFPLLSSSYFPKMKLSEDKHFNSICVLPEDRNQFCVYKVTLFILSDAL